VFTRSVSYASNDEMAKMLSGSLLHQQSMIQFSVIRGRAGDAMGKPRFKSDEAGDFSGLAASPAELTAPRQQAREISQPILVKNVTFVQRIGGYVRSSEAQSSPLNKPLFRSQLNSRAEEFPHGD
jgi:hypothetical protein